MFGLILYALPASSKQNAFTWNEIAIKAKSNSLFFSCEMAEAVPDDSKNLGINYCQITSAHSPFET